MSSADPHPLCQPEDHPKRERSGPRGNPKAVERAAKLFRAMGDGPRLRILELLGSGERCVTAIVAAVGEKFSTVSQRLRILRSEGLVVRRRDGTHLYYALADRHVADLILNALAHATELEAGAAHIVGADDEVPTKGERTVSKQPSHHAGHTHQHGPNCGHKGVKHDGHVDYLHDGHLHHMGKEGVEEHQLPVNATNPGTCTPKHDCGKHEKAHRHGPGCGHEAIPHGDHTDYLVDGHLHHPHGEHCDDHGPIALA